MAKEIVKFTGTCKHNDKHVNEYDECQNCRKQKLYLFKDESGTLTKVGCSNCHHSFTKIKCKHCDTQIYVQDFNKPEKEEDDLFGLMVFFLVFVVVVKFIFT